MDILESAFESKKSALAIKYADKLRRHIDNVSLNDGKKFKSILKIFTSEDNTGNKMTVKGLDHIENIMKMLFDKPKILIDLTADSESEDETSSSFVPSTTTQIQHSTVIQRENTNIPISVPKIELTKAAIIQEVPIPVDELPSALDLDLEVIEDLPVTAVRKPMNRRLSVNSRPATSKDLPSISTYKLKLHKLVPPSIYAKPKESEIRETITVPYKTAPRPTEHYDPKDLAIALGGVTEKIYKNRNPPVDVAKQQNVQTVAEPEISNEKVSGPELPNETILVDMTSNVKKRGRPFKDPSQVKQKTVKSSKKRGRPFKDPSQLKQNAIKAPPKISAPKIKSGRGRGRPPKNQSVQLDKDLQTVSDKNNNSLKDAEALLDEIDDDNYSAPDHVIVDVPVITIVKTATAKTAKDLSRARMARSKSMAKFSSKSIDHEFKPSQSISQKNGNDLNKARTTRSMSLSSPLSSPNAKENSCCNVRRELELSRREHISSNVLHEHQFKENSIQFDKSDDSDSPLKNKRPKLSENDNVATAQMNEDDEYNLLVEVPGKRIRIRRNAIYVPRCGKRGRPKKTEIIQTKIKDEPCDNDEQQTDE